MHQRLVCSCLAIVETPLGSNAIRRIVGENHSGVVGVNIVWRNIDPRHGIRNYIDGVLERLGITVVGAVANHGVFGSVAREYNHRITVADIG